jgi:thiol reductant ABC exporter CydC subunit
VAADSMLRHALLGERQSVRRALAAGILVSLSTIGLAGTSAWLIVRAAERPVVLSLTVPMGLVQLFALAKAAGRYLERTQTHRAALSVMGRLRAAVARVLEPLVPAGLGPRSAEVVDVVLGDVERVQDLLTAVAGPLISGAVAGALTVVVSGIVVPWSAVSLFAGLIVTSLVLPAVAARFGERSETETDLVKRSLVDLFDRAAQSGDEYVMNGAAPRLEAELERLEQRLDRAQRRRGASVGVVNTLSTLVAGLCVVTAAILSARALGRGDLSRALIAVPALLSVAALELLGAIAPVLVGLRGDLAALGRVEDLARRRAPVLEPARPGPSVDAATSLHVNAATLDYGAVPVVCDVSFELGPGDLVVLSGPSGGGKTTMARLMAKFADASGGSLDLDATPYAELRSTQVRGRVGYVDDAPHVFSTTLAGNLRIANPLATESQLLDACEAAGLAALLASLPDGLDTPLGGATTGLSGGEQRRLGVARELLLSRPVVVFDEPTEGLDEFTARQLMNELSRRYRDAAMVVITHHLDDQRVATRHLEMRDGRLVDVARS